MFIAIMVDNFTQVMTEDRHVEQLRKIQVHKDIYSWLLGP